MITVLVHYKQWVDSSHPMFDDTLEDRSKVVEVKKLTDLNNMFRHITKIDILDESNTGVLPSKDEVVNKGYNQAQNGDFNCRRALKDLDQDLYYSGWMDCFDWLSQN